MANNSGASKALRELLASSQVDNIYDYQHVNPILSRLRDLLAELDDLGLTKAAAYLAMAIDRVEVDLTTESD